MYIKAFDQAMHVDEYIVGSAVDFFFLYIVFSCIVMSFIIGVSPF